MLPDSLLETLAKLHSGPERGYHAWSHPKALLALLPQVREALHEPLALECAIVLHDVVYDPKAGDNEARSAALALELLDGVVDDEVRRRAAAMILATARHEVSPDMTAEEAADCAVFLDLDLSVLGADRDAFDRYEAGVRHEYGHVPWEAFRTGRAALLERFLARERLYLSDWGHARFEATARANLKRSIDRLRGGANA